jgi:hypothetical protein
MTYWEVAQFEDPRNAAWLKYTDFYENDRQLSTAEASERRKEILKS